MIFSKKMMLIPFNENIKLCDNSFDKTKKILNNKKLNNPLKILKYKNIIEKLRFKQDSKLLKTEPAISKIVETNKEFTPIFDNQETNLNNSLPEKNTIDTQTYPILTDNKSIDTQTYPLFTDYKSIGTQTLPLATKKKDKTLIYPTTEKTTAAQSLVSNLGKKRRMNADSYELENIVLKNESKKKLKIYKALLQLM